MLKKVVEVKVKRPRFSSPSDGNQSNFDSRDSETANSNSQQSNHENKNEQNEAEKLNKVESPAKCLLGLTYASSDDEDEE